MWPSFIFTSIYMYKTHHIILHNMRRWGSKRAKGLLVIPPPVAAWSNLTGKLWLRDHYLFDSILKCDSFFLEKSTISLYHILSNVKNKNEKTAPARLPCHFYNIHKNVEHTVLTKYMKKLYMIKTAPARLNNWKFLLDTVIIYWKSTSIRLSTHAKCTLNQKFFTSWLLCTIFNYK